MRWKRNTCGAGKEKGSGQEHISLLPHCQPALPAVGARLHMQPAGLFEDEVYPLVLSQYVKEHFCVFVVVDVNVGSEAAQVVGIRYASHPGVQTFRPVAAVDVDGSADGIAQGLQHPCT